MKKIILNLFSSQPLCVGVPNKTSFSTEATEITDANAREFFKYDYVPIKFTGGCRHGDNFESAFAIPGDVDNTHTDDPNDWVTIESVTTRLKEQGINHWIHSSRSDGKPKGEKTARDKFHVIFPLSEPLNDKKRFVAYCEWFIRNFQGDSKVKSFSQLMFGYGDHSAPKIDSYMEGRCIDEILSDEDLASCCGAASPTKTLESKYHPKDQLRSQYDKTTIRKSTIISIDQIKEAARGRELEILEHVVGIPAELLDGKHHLCPICGGKDRFRMIDAGAGAVLCNQCFYEKNGSFIEAMQHYQNVSLQNALQRIDDYLRNGSSIDIVPQYEPFPIQCFPVAMRNMVTEIQKVIGLKDCSSVATCCLAVVSAVIGAGYRIRIKRGYTQPAHVFTAIVGKSGQGKSPVMGYLLAVLHKKQKEWFDIHKTIMNDFKQKMSECKAKKKNSHTNIPKNDTVEDGYERELAVPQYWPPAPAPLNRLIISDITIESLSELLNENPLGLLLYLDELEAFFNNMHRYNKSSDMQHYNTIHNGAPLTIDRKNSGLVYVPYPSLAIVGGIQPRVLKELLRQNPLFFHSGLIARFLIAMPPVEAVKLNKNELSEKVRDSYENFIESILSERKCTIINDEVVPREFPITSEAWDVLEEYQHRHADTSSTETEENATIEDKYLTNAARIALILHVAALYGKGKDTLNPYPSKNTPPISGDTMRNACVIGEWFVNEAKRIYGFITGNTPQIDFEKKKILEVIQQNVASNVELSAREISQLVRSLNNKEGTERTEKKLREMVAAGELESRFKKVQAVPARRFIYYHRPLPSTSYQ